MFLVFKSIHFSGLKKHFYFGGTNLVIVNDNIFLNEISKKFVRQINFKLQHYAKIITGFTSCHFTGNSFRL